MNGEILALSANETSTTTWKFNRQNPSTKATTHLLGRQIE